MEPAPTKDGERFPDERVTPVVRKPPPERAEDEALNPRIRIAAGKFMRGSPPGVGGDDERPQRRVLLSFLIQEHPVTNREYRRFRPKHDPEAPEDYPVVNVSWDEAQEYAAWLGGSLPTEAQWEFAARGREGRTYRAAQRLAPEPRVLGGVVERLEREVERGLHVRHLLRS